MNIFGKEKEVLMRDISGEHHDRVRDEKKDESPAFLPENGWKRIAVIFFYIVAGALLLFVGLRCVFDIFLPFAIAWVVSMLIRPALLWLHEKTGTPLGLLCAVGITLLYTVVGASLFWVIRRLFYECGNIVESLVENYDSIAAYIKGIAEWISEKLPQRGGSAIADADAVAEKGLGLLRDAISRAAIYLPELAASVVSGIPGAVFFTVIMVTSSYYICMDLSGLNSRILSFIPKSISRIVLKAADGIKRTGASYLRAYALILLITFAELLTGFLMIGIKYSAVAALIIAIADMLPVIGVGSVLNPWAAVMFIRGDSYTGIGLLLICGVTCLVRQIVEPRIVGVSIGLSALETLVGMYAGMRIFGIVGMIVAPIFLLIAKSALRYVRKERDSERETIGNNAVPASAVNKKDNVSEV